MRGIPYLGCASNDYFYVIPKVCRRHPCKKIPCALTQASLDSATWYFFAEGGGFEPPVRLPVRQFSKLLVSATHPSFPAINAIRQTLSEYELSHESGCKGTAFF